MKMLRTGFGGCLIRTLTALTLVVLAFGMTSSWLTAAQESATAETPARIAVQVPQIAGGPAGQLVLDLSVKAFRNPERGNVGGVVRLRRQGGKAVELGRFSIFPAESFSAAGKDEERRFQFDVTSPIKELGLAGGQAEIEVALIDRSNGKAPAGAELVIGGARIATR